MKCVLNSWNAVQKVEKTGVEKFIDLYEQGAFAILIFE